MLRLILILFLCFNSTLGVLGQGFIKPIPTSSYPLPSLKTAYVFGQHLTDDGILIAFQAYYGRPRRLKSFFGHYTPQGDLVHWHEIPDTIGNLSKKIYFFDSIYVRDQEINSESTIVQAFDYNGAELWHRFMIDCLDSYSGHVGSPTEIFIRGFNGFYEYLNPLDGTISQVWDADSLHLELQIQLGFDSVLSLDRLAKEDSGTYFMVRYELAGIQGDKIILLDHSCGCWMAKASLTNDLRLIWRDQAPLLFEQSNLQIIGDSMRSELLIMNSNLDTLWTKSLIEPAFIMEDSSYRIQEFRISSSDDGYFLLEKARSRRSKESFFPDQYQTGVHYWVLDSSFRDVLKVTLWPKDTIGRIFDKMYSTSDFLVGRNRFNVDLDSSLTVCLNIAQHGLGEAKPWIVKTGAGGQSFLHTPQIEHSERASFNIFPNPVKEVLRVSGEEKFSSYQLLNLSGELVLQGSLVEDRVIDLRNLENGQYLLVLMSENQAKYVTRLLISR